MNSSALQAGNSAARLLEKPRGRGRPRKVAVKPAKGSSPPKEMAAVGTLTRTKTLLLAALRVWELKQRGLG